MAKNKAVEEETPQAELDVILNEMLGDAPEGDFDEEELRLEEEEEDNAGPSSDESVPPSEDEGAEDEPLAAKSEPHPDDDVSGESSAGSAEEPDVDEAAKREAGFRKEISKLRAKIAESEAASRMQPQAPEPNVTTAPTGQGQTPQQGQTPNKGQQIPVMVSQDGSEVYVDPDAVQRIIDERARSVFDQAMKPSESDLRANAMQNVADTFAQQSDHNREVVSRATEADDFIGLHLKNLMTQGHRFNNVSEVVQTLETFGVAEEATKHFPELEGQFDTFIHAMASPDPTTRALMYRELSHRVKAPEQSSPLEGMRKPNMTSPPSLSKAGGSRTESIAPSKAEFDELDKRFQNNAMSLSDDEFNRLKKLGRDLDISGYADMG